jgi:hypothetical protein
MWGGTGAKGEWVGTSLGEDGSGLRLGEHERFELSLDTNDLVFVDPEDDETIKDCLNCGAVSGCS